MPESNEFLTGAYDFICDSYVVLRDSYNTPMMPTISYVMPMFSQMMHAMSYVIPLMSYAMHTISYAIPMTS